MANKIRGRIHLRSRLFIGALQSLNPKSRTFLKNLRSLFIFDLRAESVTKSGVGKTLQVNINESGCDEESEGIIDEALGF